MTNRHPTPCTRTIAKAAALALASTAVLPPSASAERVTPPPVPSGIEVEAGNVVFLAGHGVGTQNYICLPSGGAFAWTLFTPEATLFSDHGKQLTTHFFSPNPFEDGVVRATWLHSRDSSTVWAQLAATSSDPTFVSPDAIPWLLLQIPPAGGTLEGPRGGDTLTATTYIQRVNTSGGKAPSTGCSQATDVGTRAFVPYEADYLFFTKAEPEAGGHN